MYFRRTAGFSASTYVADGEVPAVTGGRNRAPPFHYWPNKWNLSLSLDIRTSWPAVGLAAVG
jgi:hypothetical protein